MNPRSAMFLKNCIRGYYKTHRPVMPPDIEHREFAYVPFLGTMIRHFSFTPDELVSTLQRVAPEHVYYNAAHFKNPSAKKKDELGWIKTDLIFDIDRYITSTLPEALRDAKEDTLRLLDILRGDLGFTGFTVNFSGSKGYHVHLYDDGLTALDSEERREIVDYVMGEGLVPAIFTGQAVESIDNYLIPLPGITAPGKPGRMSRRLNYVIQNKIMTKEVNEAISYLTRIPGIGKSGAARLYREINSIKSTEKTLDRFWNVRRSSAVVCSRFLDFIVADSNVIIDRKVTVDINRLIRLHDSIHGRTGLKAMEINDLERFDPLTDAISLGEKLIDINVFKRGLVEIGGYRYKLKKGVTKMPEYLAFLVIASEIGEVPP